MRELGLLASVMGAWLALAELLLVAELLALLLVELLLELLVLELPQAVRARRARQLREVVRRCDLLSMETVYRI